MPQNRVPGTCLTCRQYRLLYLRAVCSRCYHRHHETIRAGTTTWLALESQGQVAAPRKVRLHLRRGKL
jgi:hypothetical protein